jgi:hypothetical protein
LGKGARSFAGAVSFAVPVGTVAGFALASTAGVVIDDVETSVVRGALLAEVSVTGADSSLAGGVPAVKVGVCPTTGAEKTINRSAIGIRNAIAGEAVWRFNMGNPPFRSGRGNKAFFAPTRQTGLRKTKTKARVPNLARREVTFFLEIAEER